MWGSLGDKTIYSIIDQTEIPYGTLNRILAKSSSFLVGLGYSLT